MDSVTKYRFRCTTEGVDKTVIMENDDTPTKCPDDTAHTIDLNSIVAIDALDKTLTKTEKEIPSSGAANKFDGFQFQATNDVHTFDRKYPMDYHLNKGELELVGNFDPKDHVSMYVVDVDNTLGYGAGVVLSQYVNEVPVGNSGKLNFDTDKKTVQNLKNLYCRVVYTKSNTANNPDVLVRTRGMDG